MRVLRHDTGTSWLGAVGDSLDPVTDGLALGVAKRLGDGRAGGYYLATVHDDDELRGYAVWPPDRKLILGCAGPEACAAIAQDVSSLSPWPMGIVAPERTADRFLRAWIHRSGATPHEGRAQRLMVLRELRPPPERGGRMRLATSEDRTVLSEWLAAFEEETEMETRGRDAGPAVDGMLGRGCLYVWDDEGPTSMALHNRHGVEGARIGGVYTPRERRGRGYASHLTAALSRQLQNDGFSPITLFAQTVNEQSNRIYERLGYETVQELADCWFRYPTAG